MKDGDSFALSMATDRREPKMIPRTDSVGNAGFGGAIEVVFSVWGGFSAA